MARRIPLNIEDPINIDLKWQNLSVSFWGRVLPKCVTALCQVGNLDDSRDPAVFFVLLVL